MDLLCLIAIEPLQPNRFLVPYNDHSPLQAYIDHLELKRRPCHQIDGGWTVISIGYQRMREACKSRIIYNVNGAW